MVECGIFVGDGKGFRRDVGGGDGCGGETFGKRDRDGAGAGAEVEDGGDAGAGPVGTLAGVLDDEFDESFGVGPGDEDIARDDEFEREKPGFPDEVGDGDVVGALLHEFAEGGDFVLGGDAFVLGVEGHARAFEGVGEEEFGGEARLIDALAGEEIGGPCEERADGPDLGGVGCHAEVLSWYDAGA